MACDAGVGTTTHPKTAASPPSSVLGLTEGRSSKTWVDFNLYGHQIVAHHVAGYNAGSSANQVPPGAWDAGWTAAGGDTS